MTNEVKKEQEETNKSSIFDTILNMLLSPWHMWQDLKKNIAEVASCKNEDISKKLQNYIFWKKCFLVNYVLLFVAAVTFPFVLPAIPAIMLCVAGVSTLYGLDVRADTAFIELEKAKSTSDHNGKPVFNGTPIALNADEANKTNYLLNQNNALCPQLEQSMAGEKNPHTQDSSEQVIKNTPNTSTIYNNNP